MMQAGNFAVELAEHRVAQERDAGVRRIHLAVYDEGASACKDCGEAIPAARRKAAPFARRCIACQTHFEKNMKRSA